MRLNQPEPRAGLVFLAAAFALLPGCGPQEAELHVGEEEAVLEDEAALAACPCVNPTGDPIGGGPGYRAVVPRAGATVVSTRTQLIAALNAATPGSVVYVADGASIELTHAERLPVKAGVTLASGRGPDGSPGGRLWVGAAHATKAPLLQVVGNGARITGLRIEGPDKEQGPSRDHKPRFTGIEVSGRKGFQLDNCEVFGWVSGLVVGDTTQARVNHNYFHHNQRVGLGYGVVVTGDFADVLIEANRFNYNRHAVAGSGYRGQSYEARYNRVEGNANGHVFDMHGEAEKGLNSPYAGRRIHIHRNTVFVGNYHAVIIRGRPYEWAKVEKNCFVRSSASTAVLQRYYTGNLTVGPNHYGIGPSRCPVSVASCISAAPGHRFVDAVCSPYRAEIEWLGSTGITKGCNPPANDRFCPSSAVTRAQMAAFFRRGLNLPPATRDYFVDDKGLAFEDDINRLAASGITLGCNPPTNDRFCPADQVTRGQMAAFLARAFEVPASGVNHFDDDNGTTFEKPINACAAAGIVNGCGSKKYCPGASLKREEMARFLHRALP